jgi:phosphohistidine phosphatase
MKQLTVLRHAKSSWGDPDLDDFDRPLNERGWKAARRIGREMNDREMRFDLVLASTAARVRETIAGVRETFELNVEMRFEHKIYLAESRTLLALLRALPQWVRTPLLVGHNPGLEGLLVGLSRDDARGLRRRVAEKFPTASLAVLELPPESWAEVAPGGGEIVELILARELD